MEGVVARHEVHHAFVEVLSWESQQRHGSNGQDAVGFTDNDDRAEDWSFPEKVVWLFTWLTHA